MPDIQVCVAFLCTRVKSPNKQDYKKLGKVISYLKETVHLPLVIGAEDSGTLTWNIDASFAVHPDCKSHTGACLTLGHEVCYLYLQNRRSILKVQPRLNSLELMTL